MYFYPLLFHNLHESIWPQFIKGASYEFKQAILNLCHLDERKERMKSPLNSPTISMTASCRETGTCDEPDQNSLRQDSMHSAAVVFFVFFSCRLLNAANWRPHKAKQTSLLHAVLSCSVLHAKATCCPQTGPAHLELVVLSALRSADLQRAECLYY